MIIRKKQVCRDTTRSDAKAAARTHNNPDLQLVIFYELIYERTLSETFKKKEDPVPEEFFFVCGFLRSIIGERDRASSAPVDNSAGAFF